MQTVPKFRFYQSYYNGTRCRSPPFATLFHKQGRQKKLNPSVVQEDLVFKTILSFTKPTTFWLHAILSNLLRGPLVKT